MGKRILYYLGCIEANNIESGRYDHIGLFKVLGIAAELLEEWNCCGASPGFYDPKFFNKVVLPLRNLGLAQKQGLNIMYTGCAVCTKTINKALDVVNSTAIYKDQIDYSLKPFDAALKNINKDQTGARHFLDLLFDPEIKKNLLKNIVKDLNGQSILLYSGCYSDAARIEDLKSMLVELGAKAELFSECCGGEKHQNVTPLRSKRIENANNLSAFFKSINLKADEAGFDYILTICSMCRQNIENGMDITDLETFAPAIGIEQFIGYLCGLTSFDEIISSCINNNYCDQRS